MLRAIARRRAAAEPRRSEPLEDGMAGGELEQGLDDGLVGAVAEDVRRHAPTEYEVEGVHQDRLARARLAGEDVQPGAEPDLERVDDREPRDAQRREHGDH